VDELPNCACSFSTLHENGNLKGDRSFAQFIDSECEIYDGREFDWVQIIAVAVDDESDFG